MALVNDGESGVTIRGSEYASGPGGVDFNVLQLLLHPVVEYGLSRERDGERGMEEKDNEEEEMEKEREMKETGKENKEGGDAPSRQYHQSHKNRPFHCKRGEAQSRLRVKTSKERNAKEILCTFKLLLAF